MDKKFDSVEDILKIVEENHIPIFNMHLGFITTLYDFLKHEARKNIYGTSAKDFFIQGLISITADPSSFEQALEFFMNNEKLK